MFFNILFDYCHIFEINSCMIGNAFLWKKIISWSSFEVSGLNNNFHWYDCWDVFVKSSFRDIDVLSRSCTTAKSDISSANKLTAEVKPLVRASIYTKFDNFSLEWNPEEHQLQYESNLKTVPWEQLFGFYHFGMNEIFHILPNALVCMSSLRVTLY